MFKTLTAAAALLTTIGSAHAHMQTTGQFGQWRTAAGTNDQGIAMCSAGLFGTDRAFVVKAQANASALGMHIYKRGWRIPVNQPVTVNLQIDNGPVFSLEGYGHDASNVPGFGAVEIDVPTEITDILMNGLQMRMSFPNGSEQSWQGSLTGAAAALNKMDECMKISWPHSQPAPTQPYSSQPFGNPAPAPTQPVAPTQPTGPFRGV